MPITENISEKYANLVSNRDDVPVRRPGNYPDTPQLPEGYGREFTHPDNGFVKLFCEDYDSSKKGDTQNK